MVDIDDAMERCLRAGIEWEEKIDTIQESVMENEWHILHTDMAELMIVAGKISACGGDINLANVAGHASEFHKAVDLQSHNRALNSLNSLRDAF